MKRDKNTSEIYQKLKFVTKKRLNFKNWYKVKKEKKNTLNKKLNKN